MCLSSCMGRKTPASCRSCSRRVLVSVGDFSVSWCSICGDFLEINSENSLIQVNQWSIFMMGNILDHSSVHHHHLCFWMIHQWNRCNCDKSLQTPVCVLTCLEVKLNLESCLGNVVSVVSCILHMDSNLLTTVTTNSVAANIVNNSSQNMTRSGSSGNKVCFA